MRRISILGLGLIGGSLALALKKARATEVKITGYSRRPETLARAVELKIIDRSAPEMASAVADAELVIVATPVFAIREVLQGIAAALAPGCVVTDVGSTKAMVMGGAAEFLPQSVSFIGGHPMAGKETSGIDEADAELLVGCVYCLTPGENATRDATDRLEELVRGIGAKPIVLDAETHDRLVAGVSHLPMVLSAAFVAATTGSEAWSEMARMAAGGYHDVSRLASGSPEMNRDICASNQLEIVRWIDRYIDELKRFRSLMEQDSCEIGEALSRAREARQAWLEGAAE